MRLRPLFPALAIFLTVTFIAPPVFLIAPQRARAFDIVYDPTNWIENSLILAEETITAAAAPITSYSTSGTFVYDTILIPLVRAVARMMLQQLTASVINWINGGNGTGQPSFVMNLSVHLQGVGDSAALAFISRAASAFNSPFGAAISSSLRTNYLQNTSMAGFFAANKSTLALASPNVNAFLAGDWSKGGVGAWFALTTQNQNNPYTLYQAAAGQLGSQVGQAQTNRRQDLMQSGGFLSWCGGNTTAASACVATTNGTCPSGCVPDDYAPTGCSSSGAKPQAPCTNPDGTPANAVTPGSVIHDYTQKAVVDSGFEQLIDVKDLDAALGAIVSALLNQVLGGAGGLFGASAPSSSGGRSITSQLQTSATNNTSGAASALSFVQSRREQIAEYSSAWNSIGSAANTAQANVQSLIDFCTVAASDPANTENTSFISAVNTQITEAQTALATEIAPVIAQAQAAPTLVSSTLTLASKVESEATAAASITSTSAELAATLSADTQVLAAAPPSITDIANAKQNARVTGVAEASPAGSLMLLVNNATLVDQMNLLSTNAALLKTSVCTPTALLN